ncbi:MAG: porin family protein [Vicinamibacterales bacterium]
MRVTVLSSVFVLASLFLMTSPARAQGPGFGVKVGPTFTNFDDASGGWDNKAGLQGGVFFGGNLPGTVGIMGEVLYAKKSAEQNGIKTDLYYLEIPVLLRINAGARNRGGVTAYAIGGPALDINLKAAQNNLDVKSNYESTDVGLIAGGGIELTRFIIEARGNWGLRNVLKSNSGPVTDLKTRSFAIMAGFRFN